MIPKAPPEPIEEHAPNQKPQGENSVWIPGYWSFDDEKKDYVWVSGIWRVTPPGRAWMPGHWQSVQGGFQWVPGFWSLATQSHVDYLPPPPPPADAVPGPAPWPGLDYAPGCWVYGGTHYLWRPGFWHLHRPGWIWIPASYAWTPAGCVFVEGYWDHPLQLRGLLFAPVALDRAVIARGSFAYTPAFVVNTETLTRALFARPSCHSYYFGDYFGPKYSRAGYIAWINYRADRHCPDPLFEYYRVAGGMGRHDPAWAHNLHQHYAERSGGGTPSPSRTQSGQIQGGRKHDAGEAKAGKRLVRSNVPDKMGLTHLGRMQGGPAANQLRLERISETQRAEVLKTTKLYRDFAHERRQAEARLSASTPNTLNHYGPAHIAGMPPGAGGSGPHVIVQRTLPLRLPREIVRASTATAAYSAGRNGLAPRKQPPQPIMPKPMQHIDAVRRASSVKR